MSDTRRSRGPYKRWMNEDDDDMDMPRTTRWRRQKLDTGTDIGDGREVSSLVLPDANTPAPVHLSLDGNNCEVASVDDENWPLSLENSETTSTGVDDLDSDDCQQWVDIANNNLPGDGGLDFLQNQEENEMANNSFTFDAVDEPAEQNCDHGVQYEVCLCSCSTVEGGELGRWCELGQNFSDSSPLLLLVKGHWCAILRKCSAL